jgi:hypothetical protein
MKKARFFIFFLTFALIVCGCSKKMTSTAVPGYEKKGVRLIAVMPVENKTEDKFIPVHLRETIALELFSKGYPKMPFQFIDQKLPPGEKQISPQLAGEFTMADAIMYPVLKQVKNSYRLVQTSTTIVAGFTLKSSKTGETLWQKEAMVSVSNYDFTKKRLERKSCQELEPTLQEMAQSALSTLPDGPDFIGKTPQKHAFWEWF